MGYFSITTPIFYVNARPHVGHAYTVVAADVLARLHRNLGEEVFFLTGTDEHGLKVAEAARTAGKDPQKFVDEIAASYKEAWKRLDIRYSDFIRTTESRHEKGFKRALLKLYQAGVLYEKDYSGLYCVGCEAFVKEKDLDREGQCPFHGESPVVVKERNWFFRLTQFLPHVRKAIEGERFRILPEGRKNEVLALLNRELEDFSISRSKERVPWGISLPFDDSQVAYVWIDALFNYITALGYGSGDTTKLEKFWPPDVQIIGQDILKFHAIYWPAMLLALGLELPRSLVIHGFFTVNGQKISKSLGNVIDPLALVEKYGSDATRYLLLSPFPFGNSGDVAISGFEERYSADLANTFGNFVNRTINLVEKFCGGKIPDVGVDEEIVSQVKKGYLDLEASIGEGDAVRQLNILQAVPNRVGRLLNSEIDYAAPWKERDQVKRDFVLRTMLESLLHLTNLTAPILPESAVVIREAIDAAKLPYNASAQLSPGAIVRKPVILFPPPGTEK